MGNYDHFPLRCLIMLCFCSVMGIAAQAQVKVTGFIFDLSTKTPITGVTIANIEHTVISLSDSTGFFLLTLNRVPAEIEITHIAYEKQKVIIIPEMPG